MALISLGGGPTIEERRNFSGLKEGTHVPGYRGYCPTMKFRVGKRYGMDTHEINLLAERQKQGGPPSINQMAVNGKPTLRNSLPDPTGDNKYVKQMVPGYTGYIPRKAFRFGGTYKDDCDVSIDNHISDMQEHNRKTLDLRSSVKGGTRLDPLPVNVNDRLNLFRSNDHIDPHLFMDDKKPLGEPPMPGYQGYIPRIHTTELGLGVRYHQMTKNGLEAFQAESAQRDASLNAPININRPLEAPTNNRRLYPNAGMIPKYTGYIPQKRFNYGLTYGNTTRSLDVCSHHKGSFGEFNKNTLSFTRI